MKKLFLITCTAIALLSTGPALVAQTDTNQPALPTGAPSFFNSVQNYFTTFNPELDSTFGEQKGEFAIGIDSIQGTGVNLANSLRLSYNIYKSVGVDAVVRDTGVSGLLVSAQVGPSLNFVVHDAKLSLYAHIGHRQEEASDEPEKIYGEVGVRISKALTKHTFAGIGMGVQTPGSVRTFSAFTGFTF
jgi:hypothetical protein